jgi:2-oxoglutarate dehydrogenase E1 component
MRLTGEDVQRGTFSHRHAVLHDAVTGVEHVPLQQLPQARASFEIHNSPLTEAATIGFEFGYNMQEPKHLVIWEAQYGDFINGAQIILDQFVTSGRAKWGLKPSLVFLLPHGYEGQGPEHSSARPERFLQARLDINLRLVNCTTAAQYFHVLRRQAHLLDKDPLPLIILTPKSLLRHAAVSSTPQELTEGPFPLRARRHRALTRAKRRAAPGAVQRQGLRRSHQPRAAPERQDVAICRVEQLYPFPNVALREVLEHYPSITEVAWVQEEPSNMGAWEFMWPRLEELIGDRCGLRYIGRARNSSPSEGSSAWHQVNQKVLVELAFDLRDRYAVALGGVVQAAAQPRPAAAKK